MNKEYRSRRIFISKVINGAMSVSLVSGGSLYASHRTANRTSALIPVVKSDERKFVPVMLTPYNADLSIDYNGLSRLIDFYTSSGAKGFFANCLSSEMYDLTNEERLSLVRHVVKHVNGKFPVVATGSFGETIEARAAFTKRMFDTGVDGVILITSHFADKGEGDAVMIKNLDQYLKLTGDIPLGTYECPSPYKRILSPQVMTHLLSTNRLVYHKDTSLDLENVREKLNLAKGSRLELYDAHTPNALGALRMGARGMSCIAGNFYPEIFSWMCANVENEKRTEDLEWLQAELTRADPVISQAYSLSAKYFLKKRGIPVEINSRRNKSSLSPAQKQTLENVYSQLMGWRERLGIV